MEKSPALHLFLLLKPFHSDIPHDREEKMIAISLLMKNLNLLRGLTGEKKSGKPCYMENCFVKIL